MLALCQAASAERISPVQKVVQMIDDMAGKVQKDLDETKLIFEDYAKNCDDESYAKDHAIKDSAENMEALQAVVEDANAKIAGAESNIQDVSAKISDQEADLHKSEQLREKEHGQFLSTEKEFLDMAESLEGAKKIFETAEGASLVQLPKDKKEILDKVLAGMRAVVESSFVTHSQRKEVEAFLQAKEDAEESLTLKQVDNSATIQLLEQLQEFSEKTLANARKKEMEEAHAHAMLVQGLKDEIKSLNEELQTSANVKHTNSEMLAQASKDLAVEKKSSAETEASLSDLKSDCQKRATAFEEENRDCEAELGALAKAKEILTKKFALIQTTLRTSTQGEDAKARALRSIEQLGKKYHSTSLVTLAFRASSSPFAKVTSMIEDMIAKLQQEARRKPLRRRSVIPSLAPPESLRQKRRHPLQRQMPGLKRQTAALQSSQRGLQPCHRRSPTSMRAWLKRRRFVRQKDRSSPRLRRITRRARRHAPLPSRR
jgi:DNA repair exonuclease SbcCD ATPase subunit